MNWGAGTAGGALPNDDVIGPYGMAMVTTDVQRVVHFETQRLGYSGCRSYRRCHGCSLVLVVPAAVLPGLKSPETDKNARCRLCASVALAGIWGVGGNAATLLPGVVSHQRMQGPEGLRFLHQPIVHCAGAGLSQAAGRIEQHMAFVIGDRHPERHDQGAAFQFIVEQGTAQSRRRYRQSLPRWSGDYG